MLRHTIILLVTNLFLPLLMPSHLTASMVAPVSPPKGELLQAVLSFTTDLATYPLLEQALRDPELVASGSISQGELQAINKQAAHYRQKLKTLKGEEYANGLRDYLNLLIKYSYYWGDALAGDVATTLAIEKIEKILFASHLRIRVVANNLAQLARSKREKQRLAMQVALLDFLYPSTRQKALKILAELASASLDAGHKNLVHLAINIQAVDEEKQAVRMAAMQNLDRLQNHLPKKAAMLAHLVLARAFVGIDQSGKMVGAFYPQYRQHMKLVSSLCAGMSAKERQDILRNLLSVWVQAKDFQENWRALPFHEHCFKAFDDMAAVHERMALQAWQEGKLQQAKSLYLKLASAASRPEKRVLLEEKAAALYELIYAQEQSPQEFQLFLTETEKRNRGSQFGLRLQNAHYKLLLQEMAKARKLPQREAVQPVAELVGTYHKTQLQDFRSQRLKIILAELYLQKQFFREAEGLYGELVRDLRGEQRREILVKQIVAQSHLASWPLSASWNVQGKLDRVEREHLLRLYYDLFQMDKSLAWDLTTHIGLLEIDLARPDKAFFIWENAIKAYPQDGHAQRALGLLTALAEGQQQWQKLEDLLYLGIEKNVVPLVAEKSIDLKSKLEEALYQGALALKASKQYDLAIKKLLVLENTYEKSRRYSEYLFLQAECFQEAEMYQKSLDAYEAIMTLEPSVAYFQEALLAAASIHIGMVELDAAIKKYQLFLHLYPQHHFVDKIRQKLAEIYVSRSEFDKAYTYLVGIDAAKLDVKGKQGLKNDLWYVIKKSADKDQIIKLAAAFLDDSEASFEAKARALTLLANEAYQQNSKDDLAKLEQKIQLLDQNLPVVADALSNIWYLQVKLKSETVIQGFKKVLTEDFKNVVPYTEASYKELAKTVQEVCQRPRAAYCGASMQDLIAINLKLSSLLADTVGESALNDELLPQFKKDKEAFLQFLIQDYKQFKDRAIATLQNGFTEPQIVSSLLWQSFKDWNFKLGHESGTGFMQLTKDIVKETVDEHL